MPYALNSPEDDLTPRRALVADVLLGGAVGTLLGLLVGLSGSTTVAAIAVAATALAGSVVVLRGSERAVRPLRAGALAVAAIASLLAGTWLERHGALGPTPSEEVAAWRQAGLGEREALLVTAAARTKGKVDLVEPSAKDMTKKTGGKKPLAQYCADLQRLKWKPERELLSWKRRGGEWAEAAQWIETHVSCKNRAEAVLRARTLACAQQ